MSFEFGYWANRAVEQMRFRPDRAAVKQELVAHMEDAMEAALARGLSREAAEQQVVQAMGDAREVGRLLNQAHSPLLGFAWWFSKWLCVLLAVLLVWNGVAADWTPEAFRRDMVPLAYESASGHVTGLTPGAVLKEGGYTFTLDYGSWETQELDGGGAILQVVLGFQVTADSPWLSAPYGVERLHMELPDGSVLTREDQSGLCIWPTFVDSVLPRWQLEIRTSYVTGETPEWLRFFVPDTGFDLTVCRDGEVSHGT